MKHRRSLTNLLFDDWITAICTRAEKNIIRDHCGGTSLRFEGVDGFGGLKDRHRSIGISNEKVGGTLRVLRLGRFKDSVAQSSFRRNATREWTRKLSKEDVNSRRSTVKFPKGGNTAPVEGYCQLATNVLSRRTYIIRPME